MRKYAIPSILILALVFSPFFSQARQNSQEPLVSGQLQKGYRILEVTQATDRLNFTVYRGDYIKFKFTDNRPGALLRIPGLKIQERLPGDFSAAPYFKMKVTGVYELMLDQTPGQIVVIEYERPNYRELTVDEAAVILTNETPLLLDVRTEGEYKRGHLAGAVLIPVQELQRRITELAAYKKKDILIYCATGNRSTVASKILIDSGFERILNMRRGIVGWSRHYPVRR